VLQSQHHRICAIPTATASRCITSCRAEWPVDYHVFSRDKVGSGRFPGLWDAERLDQLPQTAPAAAAQNR